MQRPRTPGAGITGARKSLIAKAGPTVQGRCTASRGRVATIRALIARMGRDLGRSPTDAQLAAMLTCSVEGVRRARNGGRADV